MKKFLALTILLSMLFCVSGVIADSVVLGPDNQSLDVSINSTIKVVVNPLQIDFGNVNPGTLNNNATNITFNANGSNVNISISPVAVSGSPFDTGLKFDNVNVLSQIFTILCDLQPEGNCSYNLFQSVPTLNIPVGFIPGIYNRVITYNTTDGKNYTQNLAVNVNQYTNVAINPATVNFVGLMPGDNNKSATSGPITLDATGSNVNVTVQTIAVNGALFSGLKLNGLNPIDQTFNLTCNVQADNTCSYDLDSTVPTVSVPVGYTAGTYNGIITYTVNGENQTQNLSASISVDEVIHLNINPKTLEFGALKQGTFNNTAKNNITFDAAGSNANIIVVTVNVMGAPFDNGLWFLDSSGKIKRKPIDVNVTLTCVKSVVDNTCSYNLTSIAPVLDIPAGFKAGPYLGTINYLITGEIPI